MDFTTAVSDADQRVHYQRSIESLEEIYRDRGVPKDVEADYNTVVGRAVLASELEYVQNILKNQ